MVLSANIMRYRSRTATFGESRRVFCETCMSGSGPDDQTNLYRDRAVPRPVRHLCRVSGGDAERPVAAVGVDRAPPRSSDYRVIGIDARKLFVAGAVLW